MSDDPGDALLARAARAMRDTTTDAASHDEEGALTLARIERTLRAEHAPLAARRITRRRVTRFVAAPIAAVLLVLTAWASASGRLPRWLHLGPSNDVERSATTGESASPPPSLARAPTPTFTVAPSAETSDVAPSSLAASASASASPSAPAPAPASAVVSARALALPAPSTLAPAASGARAPAADADALYRAAHEAHFTRHDYPSAIAAWDAYLAAAGPGGRFTLEARYNRAIALLRAGRRDEARAALQPFADGEYGGYRREEAQRLLQTLD